MKFIFGLSSIVCLSSLVSISASGEGLRESVMAALQSSLSLKAEQALFLQGKKSMEGRKVIINAIEDTPEEDIEARYALVEDCTDKATPKANRAWKAALKKYKLNKNTFGNQLALRKRTFQCNYIELKRTVNQQKRRKVKNPIKFSVNHLTFLSEEEVAATLHFGKAKGDAFSRGASGFTNAGDIPDELPSKQMVSKVADGFQSPVTDQGNCNDCYAVSFYQAMSSSCFFSSNSLYELSAQKYLSCDRGSCQAATDEETQEMTDYSVENGAVSAKQMPLTASDNVDSSGPLDNPEASCPRDIKKVCAWENPTLAAQVKHVYAPTNNQMMQIIEQYGTAIVSFMSAHAPQINSYSSGVMTYESLGGDIWNAVKDEEGANIDEGQDGFQPSACAYTNHWVTLVGYDITSEDPAQHHWIIKNSYGSDMFIDGYILLGMNGPMNPACDKDAAKHSYAGNGYFGVNNVIVYIDTPVVETKACQGNKCNKFQVKNKELSNPDFANPSQDDVDDGTSVQGDDQ